MQDVNKGHCRQEEGFWGTMGTPYCLHNFSQTETSLIKKVFIEFFK